LLALREIERRQHCRPPLLRRIPLDDLLEARAVFRRVDERRPFVLERTRRLVEGGVVRHLRMKAHRSTSPITTSIDPITAITSAISPPTIIGSSAGQASSAGARDFTRHGRLVPSETT